MKDYLEKKKHHALINRLNKWIRLDKCTTEM